MLMRKKTILHRGLLSMDIVTLFCDVDDFCKKFKEKENDQKKLTDKTDKKREIVQDVYQKAKL
jgi:hypothetical protein